MARCGVLDHGLRGGSSKRAGAGPLACCGNRRCPETALFASKKALQTPRPGSSNAPEPSETGAAIALVVNAARAAASDPPSPIVPILPTVMARPGISRAGVVSAPVL